jgi:hypothetical protein
MKISKTIIVRKELQEFRVGRAIYDASQEIRNNHITREEVFALVKRFDGEFPETIESVF